MLQGGSCWMYPGKPALLLILLTALSLTFTAPGYSEAPGSSPKYPIAFHHLTEWIRDSRMSLNLFEDTLQTDMLAFRVDYSQRLTSTYIWVDSGFGNAVYQSSVQHLTFQGMFWGPLFTTGVWEIPMFTADLVLALLTGSWLGLSMLPIKALQLSMEASEKMSEEAISFTSLFRINVLFTSDVLMFDYREVAAPLYFKTGKSLMGRSYAGLAFRILESNYFFAGFQFVHIPPIYGWDTFIATDPSFSNSSWVPRYHAEAYSGGDSSATLNNLLFYTRTQVFLYNNFLDFFQFRTLLNLDSTQVLDLLGLGFILDFWKALDLSTYFNYLKNLDKYTLDVDGALSLGRNMAILYDYQLSLKPFNALDYLKLGLDLNFRISDTEAGPIAFNMNGAVVQYQRDGTRQLGYKAELGLFLPLSGRILAGLSYNLDETMPKLPFAADAFIWYAKLELGMDRNFSSSFEPIYREPW